MNTHHSIHLYYGWLLVLLLGYTAAAQSFIDIVNPSFEELEEHGFTVTPASWKDAGFEGNWPAALHASPYGSWTGKKAKHGSNYMSLFTYDNSSWQSIYQLLKQPLLKDTMYIMRIWMVQAQRIESFSRKSGQRSAYKSPTVLRIWGFNTLTKEYEMLAESEPVTNSKWQQYTFILHPRLANYDGFQLSAYYAKGQTNTNGNLLIDQLSRIEKIKGQAQGSIVAEVRKDTVQLHARTTPVAPKFYGPPPPSIQLENPSFEMDDQTGMGTPKYWVYVGTCKFCKPVIEPRPEAMNWKRKAVQGKYYVSLLTYEETKHEAIGQQLSYPLQKDSTYTFSVKACFSKCYEDQTRKFPHPIRLCVWGYNEDTPEQELVGQTTSISHDFWYEYQFLLTPRKHDYNSIAIGACHDPGKTKPCNGNVLVDDCSPIIRVASPPPLRTTLPDSEKN